MKIVLASSSPRRRELLTMMGLSFDVIPADVDETVDSGMPPEEVVAFLSEKKAIYVRDNIDKEAIIIGADTVVAIDGLILGKPSNDAEAFEMLSRLQNRQHVVYTGVTVISPYLKQTFIESAKVFMCKISDKEIYDYIATGEPHDKAGAYAIQDRGAVFIERIDGDFYTVMGLPVSKLYQNFFKMTNFN